MNDQPWAQGPAEVLIHGLQHLERAGDVDRRLAMISIDNAVELMIKTYLDLPRRVTSGPNLSSKQRREIQWGGFGELLDALDKYAPHAVADVDLAVIEYYHDLRNQLYHQGNGLTVEQSKVEVYGDIARLLYSTLFGREPALPETMHRGEDIVWRFILEWESFSSFVKSDLAPLVQRTWLWGDLEEQLPKNLSREALRLRTLINKVTHGDKHAVESLSLDDIQALGDLRTRLEQHFELA